MANNPNIKGLTTIVWGTNLAVPNTLSGAIVESMRITPKNGAPIEIEDNNGFAAAAYMLADGFEAQITCVYDSNLNYPNIVQNLNIGLSTVKLGGSMGGNTSSSVQYNCFLGSEPEVDLARKREGTISLKLIYRPGIVLT